MRNRAGRWHPAEGGTQRAGQTHRGAPAGTPQPHRLECAISLDRSARKRKRAGKRCELAGKRRRGPPGERMRGPPGTWRRERTARPSPGSPPSNGLECALGHDRSVRKRKRTGEFWTGAEKAGTPASGPASPAANTATRPRPPPSQQSPNPPHPPSPTPATSPTARMRNWPR